MSSHVFGQSAAPDTVSDDKEDSDFDIIKLQRAAKRTRTHGTFASGSSTAGVFTATGMPTSSVEATPATAMAVGMTTTAPVPGPGAPPATEAAAAAEPVGV